MEKESRDNERTNGSTTKRVKDQTQKHKSQHSYRKRSRLQCQRYEADSTCPKSDLLGGRERVELLGGWKQQRERKRSEKHIV